MFFTFCRFASTQRTYSQVIDLGALRGLWVWKFSNCYIGDLLCVKARKANYSIKFFNRRWLCFECCNQGSLDVLMGSLKYYKA